MPSLVPRMPLRQQFLSRETTDFEKVTFSLFRKSNTGSSCRKIFVDQRKIENCIHSRSWKVLVREITALKQEGLEPDPLVGESQHSCNAGRKQNHCGLNSYAFEIEKYTLSPSYCYHSDRGLFWVLIIFRTVNWNCGYIILVSLWLILVEWYVKEIITYFMNTINGVVLAWQINLNILP